MELFSAYTYVTLALHMGQRVGEWGGHSLNFYNSSLCVLTVITSFSSHFHVGTAIIFPILWIRNQRLIESSDLLKNIQLLRTGAETEMATHPSFLAWRIPWAEEPGGYSLQSRTQLNNSHTHTHKCITFIENFYFYCYYISPTSDHLGGRGALM